MTTRPGRRSGFTASPLFSVRPSPHHCPPRRDGLLLRARLGRGAHVEDYYQQGTRWWLRLHEKGGKHHALPVHHAAEAGLADETGTPLWRTLTRTRALSTRRMSRVDVFRMIKRRVKRVGLGAAANCHTFRAIGITAFLLNGGTLERAQAIAAHESPRTTKLYDRTADEVTVEDIEKIGI